MNQSKKTDRRFWRKWYQSGAVAQERLPKGGLVILGIATVFPVSAASYQVIGLGKRQISSRIVVPTIKGRYGCGMILTRIPGNAVPYQMF